jgi:hypothetical protein
MFCPKCRAKYRPDILRCNDCEVPLVESLPASPDDPERRRVSGFDLLKEWGVFIVYPVMFLATAYAAIALRDNRFQIEILAVIVDTCFVFLYVFCDVGPGHAIKGKGTRGYSLGQKAVRQKLPLLTCIHASSLVVLVAGVWEAMRLRPHTWFRWHLDTLIRFILTSYCFLLA